MFILKKWQDLPPPLSAREADLLISPLLSDRAAEPGVAPLHAASQTSLDLVRRIPKVLEYLQHRARGTQVRSALFSDHDTLAAVIFAVKRLEGTILAWDRENQAQAEALDTRFAHLHSPEPGHVSGRVRLPDLDSLPREQLEEAFDRVELSRLKASLPEWMR